MKSFLKDFNDNFWKYMVVIVLIIMLSFSIKWTNCLCSFSDAAVRYFDRNGPNEHFSIDTGSISNTLKAKVTSEADKAKAEADKAKAEATSEADKAKAKATSEATSAANAKIAAAKKEEQAVEDKAEKEKAVAVEEAKIDQLKATPSSAIKGAVSATESAASKAATDAKKQAVSSAATAEKQVKTTESAAKSAATKDVEKEALLESFTSKVRTCEIKSPNNIVAGYMNSIDHDINNACNHPNPNECSLVKSSVTGGVQYIEARSLRKSHGEFSGVTEWTKQTA